MKGWGTRAGAALVVALGAGCALACSSFDPQVGAAQAATCVDADSDPTTDVSFKKEIRPLMNWRLDNKHGPGCIECHYPWGDLHSGIQDGELDLSTLGNLRKGGVTSGSSIVVPGMPCESALVRKLLGIYGPAPVRMPKTAPRYWSQAETQLVIDWIAEGAKGTDDE